MKTGIVGLLLMVSQALAAKPAPVSLVVDEVPVAQLLQALAEQQNRNMIISPDVSGKVSLRLQEVPWLQAIQTVVTSAGLVMRQQAGIFYIHTVDWQQKQQAKKEAERTKQQLSAPLESRSLPLSYADAGDIQQAAEKLLSPKGSLAVDKRTNRLLVRDNRAALEALQHWVAQI
ncbi:secretin N-terminal domain-containing protein, partial [Stenotrophomonas indicatrix]|uniref:secretin N-terminal domain-containing protein n=1 Tax=Stenotrophomonas indicatrix TaxID=2045451 RepID=UPI002FDA0B85